MILPDSNLLLYAYDEGSRLHPESKVWWQECLGGHETVGLAPTTIFAFLRLSTYARVYSAPRTPREAGDMVRSWLTRPNVRAIPAGGEEHVRRVLELLENCGTAGNLVGDAQLAALAIEYDAVVHTADADFGRFAEVRWFNPLTGKGSRD